jgi:PhoH-like ATPase
MSIFSPKKIEPIFAVESKPVIRHYVLDTCVLLHDPSSITSFHEHNVYLPLVVIEELDKFKKEENEKGRNARTVTRIIDELRLKGSLIEGVKLHGHSGIFRVLTQYHLSSIEVKTNDDKILATAQTLKNRNREKNYEVILVTNDINMRVRANIYDMPVEPFGKKQNVDKLHTGIKELRIDQQEYSSFKQNGTIHVDKIRAHVKEEHAPKLLANEYIRLINAVDESKVSYGSYIQSTDSIQKIRGRNETVFGITPKNNEQACALDALMDPDISLVSLIGKAGSGKTLMAIASALEATVTHKMYDKILIARPVQPMGKDIGYLPGTLEEKLSPWMQPIFDNLEFLFNNQKKHGTFEPVQSKKKVRPGRTPNPRRGQQPEKVKAPAESTAPKKDYDFLIENKTIQVEALTYIRGRSIPRQFIVIDEAQNLSPHEVKTIITRAGGGTKIILTGDIEQIDNPYLDEISNGLTYAVERMKELGITAHLTLFECERSALAEAGTKYL